MRFLKTTFILLLVFCFVSGMLMSQTKKAPSWGWKLATTPEDAHNFINGLAAYKSPHAVQTRQRRNRMLWIAQVPGLAPPPDFPKMPNPNPATRTSTPRLPPCVHL